VGYSGILFTVILTTLSNTDEMISQTKIPEGGKPLCLLLYADKSRLSSFGTAKAYPVLVRCANLPVEMRNGEDVDGGRLVGWLPIVCIKAWICVWTWKFKSTCR
jgi:hypothetical protein